MGGPPGVVQRRPTPPDLPLRTGDLHLCLEVADDMAFHASPLISIGMTHVRFDSEGKVLLHLCKVAGCR